MHLVARLRELEQRPIAFEPNWPRWTLASQTEAAIYRLLSSVLAQGISLGLPSDAELEAATVATRGATAQIPTVRNNVEVLSDRFMDRTIPGSDTVVARGRCCTPRQRDLQSFT